jgi:dethiobiotin synthetase
MADIARLLGIPVILVVGMRLGCLSHALLSAESIQADGLELAGWIANRIDAQMPVYEENVATLVKLMPAPMMAEIPWIADSDPVEKASRYIDMAEILS